MSSTLVGLLVLGLASGVALLWLRGLRKPAVRPVPVRVRDSHRSQSL